MYSINSLSCLISWSTIFVFNDPWFCVWLIEFCNTAEKNQDDAIALCFFVRCTNKCFESAICFLAKVTHEIRGGGLNVAFQIIRCIQSALGHKLIIFT